MAVHGLDPAGQRLYETARSAGDLVDQLRRLKDVGINADPSDVDRVRALLFRDAGVQSRISGDSQ